MKPRRSRFIVLLCLGAASLSLAQSIYWEDRDGNSGTFGPGATWNDLQTAMTNATRTAGSPAQRGLVMIEEGTIARTASSQTSLRLTSAAAHSMVTVSGGWEWNGGAKPVKQVGRTTLDANSGGVDSVVDGITYNGLKDANHFTIHNATNVILDAMVLVNGRPEMNWPSGRTSEAWGAAIRVVKAHHCTLTNLVVASNDIASYEGAAEYSNGGSIFARADLYENSQHLYGFRMTDCDVHHNGENDSYTSGLTLMQVGADNAPAIVERCTFRGNRGNNGTVLNVTASTDSSGVHNRVLLANCRVWNNRGAETLHTETSHGPLWNAGGGGGNGGFENNGVTPNQRVTLFGSLVAGNYTPAAAWAQYPILNYSRGLTHGEGFAVVNSTIVSNLNTTVADTSPLKWGELFSDDRGGSGDNLWFINTIGARLRGVRLEEDARSDMQASTWGLSTTNFRVHASAGVIDVWTNIVDALTSFDSDFSYRFNNRNDNTGVLEPLVAGSNRQGDPGFEMEDSDPYRLAPASASVNQGVTRSDPSYVYVDVNFDGAYTVGWDIIVKGAPPGGGQDLVYVTDLLGNPRVKGVRIDRGAYESMGMLPTVIIIR